MSILPRVGIPVFDAPDVDPSLLDHTSAGPQVNAVAWSLLVIAGGFLGLRLYCKYIGHRGLWWDDRILIAAWVRITSSLV
jgi:hypothetical protein